MAVVKRFLFYIFLALTFSLLSYNFALATVIHVPDDRPTIQAGINAAVNGDTVLVAPGTYYENINFSGKVIVVTSANGATATVIRAASASSSVVTIAMGEAKGAELSGFTVTGSTNSGIYCHGSSPTIRNNMITSNRGTGRGSVGGGIFVHNTSRSQIVSNIFYGDTAADYGAALEIEGTSTNDTIAYNVFYDNFGYGEIQVQDGVTGLQVYNNTFSIGRAIAIYHKGSSPITVRNNIFFFEDEYCALYTVSGSFVAEYNCFFSNICNHNFTPGTGNIYQYAEFVDSTNHNYHLQSSSPCINSGDPNSFFNDPDGSRNDIGALYTCTDSTDLDNDGIGYCSDNCRSIYNPGQEDFDFDNIGDSCDACTDTDNDGFGNPGFPQNTCPTDNCPNVYNPLQQDTDNDGIANACDNCPFDFNSSQLDADNDGIGDVCDACPFDASNDVDNDGFCGNVDNCPSVNNPGQADSDGDGKGNGCDNCVNVANSNQLDTDADGVGDVCDNCVSVSNSSQTDSDADGAGDACDICPGHEDRIDTDGDGVPNGCDICQGFNDHTDTDHDAVPDGCDNCPTLFNTTQLDADHDGIGNVCDFCPFDALNDPDLDSICGGTDNCRNVYNPNQQDTDMDGVGDVCDNCVSVSNPAQQDADGDGIGNACDNCSLDPFNDADGDSVCGNVDNCPSVANTNQIDADSDGYGAACDCNDADARINPNTLWFEDTDGDGFGNRLVRLQQCSTPVGYVLDSNDCNDGNALINPNTKWFFDPDNDSLGNRAVRLVQCAQPPGYVLDSTDNCPTVSNSNQTDTNHDGIGDACCCIANRGDLNHDGSDANILDLTYLVDRIFRGGSIPGCPKEADVNSDGASANILDLTFLVDRIFRGGPAPGACS